MERLILILILILLINVAYSQENRWTASLDIGLQEHDKRLFDFAQRASLLRTQTEFLGTYQVGFSMAKNWEQTNGLTKKIGIGLHIETATFRRPFNHNFRKEFGNDLLRISENNKNILVPIELGVGYSFNAVSLQLSVISQINLLSIVVDKNDQFIWGRSNLYSAEFYTSVIFRLNDLTKIRIGYRAYQLKRIDPVIFYNVVPNGDNKGYESYNPFKLLLSFQYDLKSENPD